MIEPLYEIRTVSDISRGPDAMENEWNLDLSSLDIHSDRGLHSYEIGSQRSEGPNLAL